ncbi:MAG: LicD family protein [Selenomonadaceae bacterium]|nr:LicD family protein [Selenomonadaceae bacterium]
MLKNDNENLITNQNIPLEQINSLLARQNVKLRFNEVFVRNIDLDEMRSGFLVTSHRKKLWNAQIGLINEFARICKKYNLKWFAYGGTLLGAVRHKGFIPWDDDVDIAMLRPDYNKFLKVAPEEIKYPYFFDPWYNYRLENDTNSYLTEELDLPLIKKSSFVVGGFPSFPVIKIRDSRTTQIEFSNRTNVNQGIWIDIFPFNSVPPFTEKKHKTNFEIARELFIAILNPEAIQKAIQDKQQLMISYEELEKFLKLSYKQRCVQFDNFAEKIFVESEKVGALEDYVFSVKTKRVFNLKNYDQTVYLPFEEIEIPAPSGWEDCLTTQYGDWRKMVYTHTHAKDWSADIPYTEYYRTSKFVNN